MNDFVSFKLDKLPRPGLKTKHAPSRSPVLYWCRSARVAEEQFHPTEVLTHIQCKSVTLTCADHDSYQSRLGLTTL